MFRGLRGEKGQYMIYMALLLPLVAVALGLVIDGGLMFRNWRLGRSVVAAAAHAAAQQIDRDHFLRTNQVQLDSSAAQAAAEAYAATNSGGLIRVRRVAVWADRVTVEGEGEFPTIFMRIFGVTSVRLRMSASAAPRYGIEASGQ